MKNMSNLIIRSIKDRGEKIFARISDQIRKDRLKSLYIFTGIIIIVITSYLIWFNFFNLHQVSQAPGEGENFLARITTGVKGAFADMFGLSDGNIIAEFPMRGLVARERQRVENYPFVFIDKDSAYPGGKIVKSGSGFTLNGEVIIFYSSPSGENKSVAVFADQSGQFNYSYTVQPSAEAGVYQYWAEDKTTKFIADRIRYLIVPIAQKDIASEKVTEILADDAKEDDKEIPSLALPKECSFSGAGTATSTKRIVINEVAWMGSTEHHSNEWIELKNVSSSEIDISNWWLIDQGEQIKVVFPQNTIIPAGRFFLLERTDDDSVPNVRADMIYQGILSNDEEGLRLLSLDCLIKDEVLANPKWLAGEAGSRKTMERATDFSSWQTSVFVNGTPKQRNSSGEVVLSEGNPATGGVGITTSASSQECSFSAAGMATSAKRVVINEVAWMGSKEDHNNEWIELKNVSSSEIDISNWWLIDQREQIKVAFPQDTRISASGLFLLERADDDSASNVRADIIYSNGGILSNDDANEGLRLLNPSCFIEDEVLASPKWPAGEISSRKTMERTADFLGWQTSAVVNGTPRQRNSVMRATETTTNNPTGNIQTAINFCSQTNLITPPLKTVLLNEIAWAGDDRSSANEWIELYNPGDNPVSLAGWQLLDKAEDVDIIFDSADNISAGGYFLVLRSSNKINFIPGIQANKFYTGAINNSDETIRLFDNNCTLVDEVIAETDWKNIGGNATDYRTAERTFNGWQTFAGAIGAIMGTPRAKNSKVSSVVTTTISENRDSNKLLEILISEIRLFPASQRFIELYNPNDSDVNLTGWYIRRKMEAALTFRSLVSKTHFENRVISAKSFLIIARENISQADIILPELTLTNSNAIQLKNASGTIMDKVGWGNALSFQGTNPAPNPSQQQSIQRRIINGVFVNTNNNIEDFELQNCPSPKSYFGDCPAEIAAIKIIEVIFDPEGSDKGKERVILKNPNNLAIDLSGYSLQYLGQNNDFSEIKKKNFEAGNSIPSEGIFIIGMNCSGDIPYREVDLSWSRDLKNQSGTLFLVSHKDEIRNAEDPGIIDVFKYSAAAYLPRADSFIASFQLNILEIS